MKKPHAADWRVKMRFAINDAIMNWRLRPTQIVARLTAINCRRNWMEKKVKYCLASARNPAMK